VQLGYRLVVEVEALVERLDLGELEAARALPFVEEREDVFGKLGDGGR
jgi:hypothetical protein